MENEVTCSHHEGCTNTDLFWRDYTYNNEIFGFCIDHTPTCAVCDEKAIRSFHITYDLNEFASAGENVHLCRYHAIEHRAELRIKLERIDTGPILYFSCNHCEELISTFGPSCNDPNMEVRNAQKKFKDHICYFNDPIKEPDSCYN